MTHSRTVTCRRCGRIDARRPDGGLPGDWAAALVPMGRIAQQTVYVCPRCPLPENTLNRQRA